MARLRRSISVDKPLPAPGFDVCRAKTNEKGEAGISVLDHLRNVAHVCQVLKGQLPLSLAKPGGISVRAAAVHDVGKASPGFQMKYFREELSKICPEYGGKSLTEFCTDHSHTGASAIWNYLGDPFNFPLFAQIAAIHHGSARQEPSPVDTGSVFGGPEWSRQRGLLIQEVEKEFGTLEDVDVSPALRNFIAGMVTVSDWIGSDERFFPANGLPVNVEARDAARLAIAECGLGTPTVISGKSFEEIFGFSPYDLQEKFSRHVSGPGVYVLEAPMGMGKTEAALYAAYRLISAGQNNGLFFGLPTRLTSERIYERIDSFLDKVCDRLTRPKLAHGTAWLSTTGTEGGELAPGSSWFNPRKRALLHPFVVGTIDQALLSVLRVKHYFVRTYALAGKVVILDEVHSYDGYTGTLLDDMVHQLSELGCSVIILSATLTAERRSGFFKREPSHKTNAYPLITSGNTAEAATPPEPQPYKISLQPFSTREIAEKAVEKARDGHCVLCIANTVATAQSWFDAVQAEMVSEEFSTGLVHSKFPSFRRDEIEKVWIDCLGKKGKRPAGCVLIATQVVEQSVDIDADFLITELAPTDMLLQRMGRVWRHRRLERPCEAPEVVVLAKSPENAATADDVYGALGHGSCKVYAPWVLFRTWHVWKEKSVVILPGDIRDLLEDTYSCIDDDKAGVEGKLRDEFVSMRDSLRDKAKAALATVSSMPVGEDKEGCATRYSDLPTSQVLLVKCIDSTGNAATLELLSGETVQVNLHYPDIATTKILHTNLVTVASYLLAKLPDPAQNRFFQKHFHEPVTIFTWDETSGNISVGDIPTEFRYSPVKGLYRQLPQPGDENKVREYVSDYEGIDVFNKSRFDW